MTDDLGPRRPGALRREPQGRRSGLVTPSRLAVALALVGSVALIGYGFVRRDQTQVPILASGMIVLGLTLLAVGFWAAIASFRNARSGRAGRAFVGALVGGILVLAAAVALAGAVVLSLVWKSTPPGS